MCGYRAENMEDAASNEAVAAKLAQEEAAQLAAEKEQVAADEALAFRLHDDINGAGEEGAEDAASTSIDYAAAERSGERLRALRPTALRAGVQASVQQLLRSRRSSALGMELAGQAELLSVVLDGLALKDVAAYARTSIALLRAAATYLRESLLLRMQLGGQQAAMSLAWPLRTTALLDHLANRAATTMDQIADWLQRPTKIIVLIAIDVLNLYLQLHSGDAQDGPRVMQVCGPSIRRRALRPTLPEMCGVLVKHFALAAHSKIGTTVTTACEKLGLSWTFRAIATDKGLADLARVCWVRIGAPDPDLYLDGRPWGMTFGAHAFISDCVPRAWRRHGNPHVRRWLLTARTNVYIT